MVNSPFETPRARKVMTGVMIFDLCAFIWMIIQWVGDHG